MRKIFVLAAVMVTAFGMKAAAETAQAQIKSTADTNTVLGTATLEDTAGGLKVSVQVEKTPPGKHGIHIHEFGSCEDLGNKAGSHYNPAGHQHGHVTKDGVDKAHPGDLGNIDVAKDGKGKLEAIIPGVTLSTGKMNVAGRAIVLHEKADDFGQPVGNAGGRIGCGAIKITGK